VMFTHLFSSTVTFICSFTPRSPFLSLNIFYSIRPVFNSYVVKRIVGSSVINSVQQSE